MFLFIRPSYPPPPRADLNTAWFSLFLAHLNPPHPLCQPLFKWWKHRWVVVGKHYTRRLQTSAPVLPWQLFWRSDTIHLRSNYWKYHLLIPQLKLSRLPVATGGNIVTPEALIDRIIISCDDLIFAPRKSVTDSLERGINAIHQILFSIVKKV